MHITLTPQRRDERLFVSRTGDCITLNGVAFDFTPLAEGDLLPREAIGSDWFAGDVLRINGVLHFALFLPHGPSAPDTTLFPQALTLAADGPVDLPAYDNSLPSEEAE